MPEPSVSSLPVSVFLKEAADLPAVDNDVYVRVGALQPGSAYVQYRGTKVFAVVAGPRELNRDAGYSADVNSSGRLMVSVKQCPFSTPDRTHPSTRDNHRPDEPSANESHLAQLVQTALNASVRLDQYARSGIQISATVIEDTGDVLPALIMCSSAALMDARILLYDMVVAGIVDVHCNDESRDVVVFPGAPNEGPTTIVPRPNRQRCTVCVALMPSLNQVGLCHVTGPPLSVALTNDAVKRVVSEACPRLALTMQQAVLINCEQQTKSS